MLKVVVFDSGFGGELFADYFEEEMPVVEIILVIDWRHAENHLKGPRAARKLTREAIRPYIGRVDLIVFANQLVSVTSLKYFRRKYRGQKFVGLGLKEPERFLPREVLVLTTQAVAKTINYQMFLFRMKRRVGTMTIDDWLGKIDDGELSTGEIEDAVRLATRSFRPEEVVLAASQLVDIKRELQEILGRDVKIYDSFRDTLRKACKALGIRGGTGKKR
jgi:glutamate racemase